MCFMHDNTICDVVLCDAEAPSKWYRKFLRLGKYVKENEILAVSFDKRN